MSNEKTDKKEKDNPKESLTKSTNKNNKQNTFETSTDSKLTEETVTNKTEITEDKTELTNEIQAEKIQTHPSPKINELESEIKENNMLFGIIGAIIGSLVGLILWIIIYRLGYIAGIAGFVITIGAFKGYKKLGKNLNKTGTIITVIIIIIMVWLSNKLACTISAYEALKDYYSFTECFTNLFKLLESSNLTSSYYKDLAVGYFLTILCSYKTIADAFKNELS